MRQTQGWTIIILTLTVLCLHCTSAQAGWIVEWMNTTKNAAGSEIRSEPATMYIAGNHMRVDQPTTVSITDYEKQQLSLLDPVRKLFWSGTLDEYIDTVTRERNATLKSRVGTNADLSRADIDLESLPLIEIVKLDETKTIAGQLVRKHEIRANGEAFQDLWLAAAMQTKDDLAPDLYLAYQRKMGATMLGKSAADYDALYRSEEYRKLLGNGFALGDLTRHIAGSFERTATAVHPTEITADKFEVPSDYRRVRLDDVFASGG